MLDCTGSLLCLFIYLESSLYTVAPKRTWNKNNKLKYAVVIFGCIRWIQGISTICTVSYTLHYTKEMRGNDKDSKI